MQVLVDADACPVYTIAENIAKNYNVPCILLCDTNHIIESDYSEVRTIGAGKDAVDMALLNICGAGDVVVTQDYGLASLALAKKAYVINQSGMQYTDDNIDKLLFERHLAAKERSKGKKGRVGKIKKRTSADDGRFSKAFDMLLSSLVEC